MGIKKGTKLTDSPKAYTLKVRMDNETNRKLNELAEKENITKAEVIRRGIDIQYERKTGK